MSDIEPAKTKPRWRRWARRIAFLAAGYLLLLAGGCMNPSTPFDVVINLGPVGTYDALKANPAKPKLAVLQHGICRSGWSLWRLERALEAHGYEVLNPSYGSTQQTIEEHAATLERQIESHLATREGAEPELVFIGHSMGGLVIREYLTRKNAREASACVFIATPHRGAALAAKRKELFVFKLFMGTKASLQLERGHDFYQGLGPVPSRRIGCIFGGAGDAEGWNDDIPGDDDGTVGTEEAQLPEQTDSIRLELGHTRIAISEATIECVLQFLKTGKFPR